MSTYPGTLDDLGSTNPASSDAMNDGAGHAAQHSEANDAIDAIQATLGVNPQGSYTDVGERLDLLPDPVGADDGDVLTIDSDAWVIAPATGGSGGGGLVLVDSGTFSASSAETVDACFTSTYDEYRLFINITAVGTGTPSVGFRGRASSSDVGSVHYGTGWAKSWTGGYVAWGAASAAASMPLHYQGFTDVSVVMILSKVGASRWRFSLDSTSWSTGIACEAPGMINAAIDGFKLIPSSSTITGEWRLYGYAK